MNIELRYFDSVRESLGRASESVALPEHVQTVGELRAYLRERGSPWKETLAEGRALRMAFNQEMTDATQCITEGSEIAFFPPVTGG